MNTATASTNEALTPVSNAQRVFRWHDHASLWFSLGVGLLVMQVGAYLMPALGTQEAVLAIVAGSIIGAGLLGWVAKIGCDSGLASAGLMHAVYGRAFARLPIVLNIVQLIGWGSFELVVMRDATVSIGRQSGAMAATYWPMLATLLWGGVITLLISGSMVQLVRRIIARVALPLVVLSLLWLSWQFLGLAQAVACGQARVQLISPFVGRIYDWYKKQAGAQWVEADRAGANDPGVQSVHKIYNHYKHFGIATEVMGASFRNVGQITALAGCDLLTIAPDLLAQLAATEAPLQRALSAEAAQGMDLPAVQYDEAGFRYALNEDAMATEKLAEGIRAFAVDAVKLEQLISAL